MRLLMAVFFLFFSCMASAAEAPPGQVRIDAEKVLRGKFVELRQMSGLDDPLRFSGRFVVAPKFGLIWHIEKPFPTSTVVTPARAIQDIGGIAVALRIKKLAHIYRLVSNAMAGNWEALDADFAMALSGDAKRWHMTLTPRKGGKSSLPYASIALNGGRFVETIVLKRKDGLTDAFSFSEETLEELPLLQKEATLFVKAGQP